MKDKDYRRETKEQLSYAWSFWRRNKMSATALDYLLHSVSNYVEARFNFRS